MTNISVLQLDTQFPRLPGDIACPDTYLTDFEAIRVPNARISTIVTDDPSKIDAEPYIAAASHAKGDMIATSCGFLAPLQDTLESVLGKPFVVSSLTQLPELMKTATADQIAIFTFDIKKFSHTHLLGLNLDEVPPIFGLLPDHHLHQVITQDLPTIDQDLAQAEILDYLQEMLSPACKYLFLECTNLPVYKSAIQDAFDLTVFDALSTIETKSPGTISPKFL